MRLDLENHVNDPVQKGIRALGRRTEIPIPVFAEFFPKQEKQHRIQKAALAVVTEPQQTQSHVWGYYHNRGPRDV